MKYQFVHVKDKETLEKVYRFRYEILHGEIGWIGENEKKEETDKYDPYSDQFAILDCEGEVCATVRLIHDSPVGYPTERFLDLDKSEYQFDRTKLSEMSRIFISSKYRNMRETRIFISALAKGLAYEKMKEYDIEYCYGMLEQRFLKLVNMFKIPYQPISKLEHDLFKLKHPSMMYVKDLEKENPQIEVDWGLNKKISLFSLGAKIKPEQVIA